MKKKRDVHVGGRPEKYDKAFYKRVLAEYVDHSYSQLAEMHGVSVSTVIRWVRKGRALSDA